MLGNLFTRYSKINREKYIGKVRSRKLAVERTVKDNTKIQITNV